MEKLEKTFKEGLAELNEMKSYLEKSLRQSYIMVQNLKNKKIEALNQLVVFLDSIYQMFGEDSN